jgi:hypothetical protein
MEEFREFHVHDSLRKRYAVSNYGRLVSFTTDIQKGTLLRGSTAEGYKTLAYALFKNGKRKSKCVFVYKKVAELFVKKTSPDQTFVIHLDHSRDNDKAENLRWATREELTAHNRKSPRVMAANKQPRLGIGKLTSTQVMYIKKRLQDPKRKTRAKMIAKQFGVSEMQISRIKSGENWGHIVV